MNTRTRLRIAGQSGTGLLSVGSILIRSLRDMGFYCVADREFPSLIKGGHSCFTINFSDQPLKSLSQTCDILVTIDKPSTQAYFDTLDKGGVWVHGYERPVGLKDFRDTADKRHITTVHMPTRTTAKEVGGTDLQQNVVLTGMAWKVLGLPYDILETEMKRKFAKKPQFMESNLAALKAGYERTEYQIPQTKYQIPKKKERRMLIDGNHAIALGAIHAGVRVYYAYPMSPSSSILTHMADYAKEVGMIVKQGEDEITVANLNMGSWYAGTRSLCATSGGGYDLMTETVSLAGIIETPWVGIIVQRPGPATGLPTWTAQGDLNLAIYSSHGEFARCVIAVSDPEDNFTLIQHALNLAEKFQIPVIVLSDRVTGESLLTVPEFAQNTIPIERHLVTGKNLEKLDNHDRYKITKDGVSKRWIPCSHPDKYYFANGDEHDGMGRLDEDQSAGEMYAKRFRKLETLEKDLPEPEVLGVKKEADISFVGWGSSKNVMQDIIGQQGISGKRQGVRINYLHYSYVYPLKTKSLEKFFKDNPNVHLIEGNHTGQLGQLIEQKTSLKFKGKLLKWNGRPFFVEDLENYIKEQMPKTK